MRRSNAPSALNSHSKFTPPVAKKPRLSADLENVAAPRSNSPLESNGKTSGVAFSAGPTKNQTLLDLMRDPTKIRVPPSGSPTSLPSGLSSSLTDGVDSTKPKTTKADVFSNERKSSPPAPLAPRFSAPSPSLPSRSRLPPSAISSSSTSSSTLHDSFHDWEKNLYFNCVYAKQSTRKHKKWEGDGVIIIKGKSVVLKVRLFSCVPASLGGCVRPFVR